MKRWKIWLKNSKNKSETNPETPVPLWSFREGVISVEEESFLSERRKRRVEFPDYFFLKSKGLLFILFCFIFLLPVWGQSEGTYVKTYEWRSGCRDTLPFWVFEPKGERFIGVSDPCLQPEIAKEQAIQRALFMYGLQQGVEIKVIFDYLTAVKRRFSFDREYSKMLVLATCTFHSDSLYYEIVDEYTSRFGEVFVTITVSKGEKRGIRFSASAEFMIVENKELKEEREMKLFLDFVAEGFEKIKATTYSCKGNRNYRQILTTINDSSQLIPYGRYWYKDDGYTGEYTGNACKMTDSFWGAFTETLLNEITLYTFPTVYLKKMSESFQDMQRELKRELIKEKVSIRLGNMGIQGNLLQAGWHIKIKN